jgi:hypothetical protein
MAREKDRERMENERGFIMRRMMLTFFWSALFVAVSAQHAYVVLGLNGTAYRNLYFDCGTELKLKMNDGKKLEGRIDTVFADGMVFSGDTVLFAAIHRISFKYPNKKWIKTEFIVSGVGLGIAGIFAMISAINAARYPPGSDKVQTVAGASAVFILATGPILIDAVLKETTWKQRRVNRKWILYGRMMD